MKILLFAILGALITLIALTLKKKPTQNITSFETQNINDMATELNEPISNASFFPYKFKYLLTKNEYYFYNNIKQITTPLNLQILAKIRLADLIEVDKIQAGKDYMKYFAKIKSKHIDFAIADNMKIIALIELDDNSHQQNERVERDNFVNNALLKVGYTVIRTNGNIDIVKQALIDKGYHVNLYQNTM